jgi:hypothetical protein
VRGGRVQQDGLAHARLARQQQGATRHRGPIGEREDEPEIIAPPDQ